MKKSKSKHHKGPFRRRLLLKSSFTSIYYAQASFLLLLKSWSNVEEVCKRTSARPTPKLPSYTCLGEQAGRDDREGLRAVAAVTLLDDVGLGG